jgi:hypothetical protein
MSFATPIPPCDREKQEWSQGSSRLTQQFCRVSRFVCEFKTQLRFGRLSRSPLQLERFLIKEEAAECDCIARNPDPWDLDLAREISRRHAALQALRDAIDLRALLFASLPELRRARVRFYRASHNQFRELIIVGNLRSRDSSHRSVHSVAMRAKLVGLRFDLDNGSLRRLPREEQFGFCD